MELARARLDELRRQLAERRRRATTAFAESLELMSFLTTLLGSEHVDRFIPQATRERPPRERAPPAADSGVGTAQRRAAAKPRLHRATAVDAARSPRTGRRRRRPGPSEPPKPDKMAATVIADAARLLSWGREWPQLAGLIARLADRPPEKEVWAILRTHRAAIEARARRIPD